MSQSAKHAKYAKRAKGTADGRMLLSADRKRTNGWVTLRGGARSLQCCFFKEQRGRLDSAWQVTLTRKKGVSDSYHAYLACSILWALVEVSVG